MGLERTSRSRALSAYRAQPVRPPACAGSVYPDAAAPLRRALDGWLAPPPGALPPLAAPPRLVVSPHIDYPRGARGYAHAARALAASDAELFVVFGTAHQTPARLYTLTRLDFATPLGVVPTDRAAVDALVAALGAEALLGDELAHRDEHSVELQAVLLAHLVRRPFTMLPVLCSSLAHLADPAAPTAPFLAALARAVAGRAVCFVAGADLAHVGPLYGDARAPPPAELARLADEDRRTLGYVAAGDAAGFHRDAVRDETRRRLCGTAPIYAAMRASGAGARLLHYEQWSDGKDSVSFAAAAG
jgi:AmmeMemoRadiSam system protein B